MRTVTPAIGLTMFIPSYLLDIFAWRTYSTSLCYSFLRRVVSTTLGRLCAFQSADQRNEKSQWKRDGNKQKCPHSFRPMNSLHLITSALWSAYRRLTTPVTWPASDDGHTRIVVCLPGLAGRIDGPLHLFVMLKQKKRRHSAACWLAREQVTASGSLLPIISFDGSSRIQLNVTRANCRLFWVNISLHKKKKTSQISRLTVFVDCQILPVD